MRVLVAVDNSFFSDVRVTKECRVLAELADVHVVHFDFGTRTDEQTLPVISHPIHIRKKWKDAMFLVFNTFPLYEWYWTYFLLKKIKKLNPQVLHVHDLYMAKSARKAILKSQQQVKLVLDLHENFPEAIRSYNWTKGWLRSRLVQPLKWLSKEEEYLSYADQIIVLSEGYKSLLLDRYNKTFRPEQLTVYPNVVDTEEFSKYTVQLDAQKKPGVTLLYFGGVAERRGIFETINALRELLNEQLPANLLIIGPLDEADKQRFFHMISQPDVASAIEYIPWIELHELPTYMHLSDICLAPFHKNPQHESGIANKLFQYMFGGKPIVASNCKPQQELIEEAECGLVFSNQTEYVSALRMLILDDAARSTMGENGKRTLMEKYSGPKFNEVLTNLYRKFV
jgi:glycosyltransferase involved in cell wall biosynthesis